MKIKEAIVKISTSLESMYGSREAKNLAYLLTGHVLNISKERILSSLEIQIDETIEKKIHESLDELLKWKPVQHIIGDTIFHNCIIHVNKDVLVPRPETEELVSTILNEHKNKSQEITILDIGTGSGCIAIALKKKLPAAEVHAADISEKALSVAEKNASENCTEIVFHRIDILDDSTFISGKTFNIIVSNPPYVRESEKKLMKRNVLDFEPSLALFVTDQQPLLFYDAIARFAGKNLKKRGSLYLEINEALADETALLFQKANFTDVLTNADLSGKPRFLSCVKP